MKAGAKGSTTKHTPGPWTIDSNAIVATFEGQEVQLCSMNRTQWSAPHQDKNLRLAAQTQANARLIAAAPEMAEFVRQMALVLRIAVHGVGPQAVNWSNVESDARALLARIDGAA